MEALFAIAAIAGYLIIACIIWAGYTDERFYPRGLAIIAAAAVILTILTLLAHLPEVRGRTVSLLAVARLFAIKLATSFIWYGMGRFVRWLKRRTSRRRASKAE